MNERDWQLVEALQKGIPLCPRPYAEIGRRCAMDESEVIERIKKLRRAGVIRRFGARIGHIRAGIGGNVLVAWQVPEERVEQVAHVLASQPDISHCYERPGFDDFPYNLYTMLHAGSAEKAVQRVRELSRLVAISRFELLPTVRELKKSSPVFRRPAGG